MTVIFAELLEASFTKDQPFAEKLSLMKPKLKVLPSLPDSFMNSTRALKKIKHEKAVSSDIKSEVIVIESPVFRDTQKAEL